MSSVLGLHPLEFVTPPPHFLPQLKKKNSPDTITCPGGDRELHSINEMIYTIFYMDKNYIE